MKKAANKALALILSLTLVLSCAGVAFAGNSGDVKSESVKVQEKQVPAAKTAEAEAAAKVSRAVENAASSKAYTGEFRLAQMKTGNEDIIPGTVAFDQDEIVCKHPNYSSLNIVGHSTAVTVPSKGTVIMAAASHESSGKSMTFGLFKDPEMTIPVENSGSVSAGSVATSVVKVAKSGTYYIGAYSLNGASFPEAFANQVTIAAAFANGADRTLTSGAWHMVGQKDAQKNYFKYVPKYSGYIKVYLNETSSSSKVTLLNYKRYIRSNAIAASSYRIPITFGVVKGNTYYIKVDAASDYNGGYQIKVSNYSVSDTSGSTKAKARTLTKGYTKKGVIAAGSSTSDWYKLKITSRRDFKVIMKGGTNKSLKMSVYNSKGKLQRSGTFDYNNSQLTYSAYNYPAGTYYIKISRNDSLSSGWYSLKW